MDKKNGSYYIPCVAMGQFNKDVEGYLDKSRLLGMTVTIAPERDNKYDPDCLAVNCMRQIARVSSDYVPLLKYMLKSKIPLIAVVSNIRRNGQYSWFEATINAHGYNIMDSELCQDLDLKYRVSDVCGIPRTRHEDKMQYTIFTLREELILTIDNIDKGIYDRKQIASIIDKAYKYLEICVSTLNYENRMALLNIKSQMMHIRRLLMLSKDFTNYIVDMNNIIDKLAYAERRKSAAGFCVDNFMTVHNDLKREFHKKGGFVESYYRHLFNNVYSKEDLIDERNKIVESLREIPGHLWDKYSKETENFAKGLFYKRMTASDELEIHAMMIMLEDLEYRIEHYRETLPELSFVDIAKSYAKTLPMKLRTLIPDEEKAEKLGHILVEQIYPYLKTFGIRQDWEAVRLACVQSGYTYRMSRQDFADMLECFSTEIGNAKKIKSNMEKYTKKKDEMETHIQLFKERFFE